ncbi:MAG TPA: aldehyde dehydrogenase family protein [Candidatus Avipropionibacterium avicola]|uniref:Aldehyde dehydrogenase n=1 Tax=Candidatus Avipropionibacterium avicola TaxID=2840701 RepID=A0A9D1GWQ5_9ACTN|nr:aldehyde dehydrogenase family protein [Candidatus Avipropionibacterium avicola]
MDEVVRIAREAAHWWQGLTPAERRRRLLGFKHHLVAELDQLVEVIRAEAGKPVHDATVEALLSITHLDWAARHAAAVMRRRPVRSGLLGANQAASVGREPYGVVAVIGPWNYPLFTPGGSIWYALAAGNAVVFKPSEFTPGVGELLARLWWRAVPEHPVLQTVTGDGAVGSALIDAGVDKVAFTGSTRTASAVMARAAETLTPVVLECGGKDAMLVAEDADLAAAARSAVYGSFSNAGQTCVGVKRVYVVDTVAEGFLAALDDELVGVVAGPEPDASYGPMVMPGADEQVTTHLRDAVEHGGTVRHGGAGAVRAPYVDPIVVVDVDEDSAAVQQETFGPLLVVNRVRDLDDAVARANAVPLGLAASVFTADRATARRVAAALRCGTVMVNSALAFMAVPTLPFGGRGDSGFGRIHGVEGITEFSVAKSVSRQRFGLPVDVMTVRPTPSTTRLLRQFVRLRHGRH